MRAVCLVNAKCAVLRASNDLATTVPQLTEIIDQLTAMAPNWVDLPVAEQTALCQLALEWCTDMQDVPDTDLRWTRYRWKEGLPPQQLRQSGKYHLVPKAKHNDKLSRRLRACVEG